MFFVLILSQNRVAACSNFLHISVVSSSVWATIAAASANSISEMLLSLPIHYVNTVLTIHIYQFSTRSGQD